MKSLTIFKDKKFFALSHSKGFTLIEMVIVLSLVSLLGGLGLYFGFDSLRGYSFHSDRDVLVSTLHHARSESISNICRGENCEDGKNHGVFIDNTEKIFTIFQGESYESRDIDFDIKIDFNKSTSFSGATEVIFSRLSGNILNTGNIIVVDGSGKNSVISVGSEGQIIWTN